jgi:hypothetical protein
VVVCKASYASRVKRIGAERNARHHHSATLDAHLDCAGRLFAFLEIWRGEVT